MGLWIELERRTLRWRRKRHRRQEMHRRENQRRKTHQTRNWNEYVAAERRHLLVQARKDIKNRPEAVPLVRERLLYELRKRVGAVKRYRFQYY